MTEQCYVAAPDIANAFCQIGLENGDTVMLHCDAMVTAQFPPGSKDERFSLLIDTLEDILGDTGTLVLPTFTYSFTQNEAFDVVHTPSAVGAVSEYFRMRPTVHRSLDPLFSVAASGHRAQQFAGCNSEDCFGVSSAFDLLFALDGKVVCLGCSLDRATFVHYVEQSRGVDYRYPKEFSGEIIDARGERHAHSVQFYVRDLERGSAVSLDRLRQRLVRAGTLNSAILGRVGILAVSARDFFREAQMLLDEDFSALIEEGSRR